MTFYTYMTRNYRGSNSPEGDLADDMYRDRKRFPRNGHCKLNGWYAQIKGYLEQNGACIACLELFEKCWEEYVRHEKSHTKMSKEEP